MAGPGCRGLRFCVTCTALPVPVQQNYRYIIVEEGGVRRSTVRVRVLIQERVRRHHSSSSKERNHRSGRKINQAIARQSYTCKSIPGTVRRKRTRPKSKNDNFWYGSYSRLQVRVVILS
jgi:hypothetical protein